MQATTRLSSAFAEHGEVGRKLSPEGADSSEVLREFTCSGVDLEALSDLLSVIAAKAAAAVKE